MGDCTYCGKPAGFLKKKHKECEAKFHSGTEQMVTLIEYTVTKRSDLQSLETQLKEIASQSYIPASNFNQILVKGWEEAVSKAFEDGILTEEEEAALKELKHHFSLSKQELDRNGAFTRVAKGSVLRGLLNGILPEWNLANRNFPFNLQKTEKIVWVFKDVKYYEQKTRKHFKGGHHGVSIRVAKGLYYRVGAFKGQPVITTETVHADTGLLGVTNKHLYFVGDQKSFRIRHDKIVSFTPYEDGLGVQRDAATAKPQIFVTGDGWFTYNLVTNVSQL